MTSNLDRYKKNLDELVKHGKRLEIAIRAQTLPDKFREKLEDMGDRNEKEMNEYVSGLPSFAL